MPGLAIFTAIRAFGFWGVARDALSAGWKWLVGSRTHLLLGLCALLAAVALCERYRADKAEDAMVKLAAAAKAAQAKATAAQIAVNHQPAAISAAIAENTNAQAPAQAARVRAAVDAYARAHPAGCLRADGASGAGNPDLPRTDQPAGGGGGADVPSDMVAITRADLDGFAANTRDLDALRAAIAQLIARHVVVIDTSQPQPKPQASPTPEN